MRRLCLVLVLLSARTLVPGQNGAGHPVAAMPVAQRWQTFTDPNEGAFQVDMPVGWKNSGGTMRWNALQYRSFATSVSPDGLTILDIGDTDQQSYATPMIGFPPGSIYGGGGGTQYMVAPIQTAQQYAVSWGTRKLQGHCSGVKTSASNERADLNQKAGYTGLMGVSHDFGDASLTCQQNGVQINAYVVLGVMVLRTTAVTALWYPDTIIAFMSPAPVSGVAAGMMAHMVQSYKPSLQWLARQSQTAVQVSQIATQTNNAISNDIMSGWESRGATMDSIMAADSRARLGIDVYSDPETGTEYTVSNNSNYYWTNASGAVVGTQTDTSPGADFRQLTRVPPK